MTGQANLTKENKKVKINAWLDMGISNVGEKSLSFLELLLNPDYESLRLFILCFRVP